MAKGSFFKKNKELLIASLTILPICLILIIEANIFYNGFNQKVEKADVIIVLGCAVWEDEPSPMLLERIFEAQEAYKQGLASKIIASGGRGEGEKISEAKAIKEHLIKLGVNEKDILLEDKSTDTYENMLFSKKIMREKGYKDCIIVTNYFHIYRSMLLSKEVGVKASALKAKMPSSFITLVISNVREVLATTKYFVFSAFGQYKQQTLINWFE